MVISIEMGAGIQLVRNKYKPFCRKYTALVSNSFENNKEFIEIFHFLYLDCNILGMKSCDETNFVIPLEGY